VSTFIMRPSWGRLRYVALLLLCAGAGLFQQNAAAAIAYVQSNSVSPSTTVSTMSVPFTAAQTAGDLIVVGLSWGSGVTISSVTDTKGNTYALAAGPTTFSGAASAIYYAKNIVAAAAGANTVTVTFSAATGTPDLRVAEYSGINTTSPLDVTAVSTGTSITSDSGSATTTNANDLLVGVNAVLSGTAGAGTGYTSRQISTFDGNILEDKIVSATGAYSATATLSSSAAWIMQMAAFKGSGSADTTPPSAPTGLTASVVSSSQINLSWTASTDNVGVTGYKVERCQGASCTTFAQIGTPTTTSYADTGLSASTSYSYRVRATDAAGNLSAYSSTVSASTASNPITYVQSNSASPSTTVSTISTAFPAAQAAGHFIVVGVSWGAAASISSVTDTKGNTYTLAVGPTTFSGAASAIYYARNIVAAAAGANTVTVTFNTATGTPDLRVAEYSGVDTTSPLDVTAASTGTSATSNSGSATTTNANDLLIGSNAVLSGTQAAGTGYTSRQISAFDGNILEDKIVSATGAYSATATLSSSAAWVMQMAAFKAAGSSSGDTTPPSTPTGLTATVASGTQINLSWTASTDNVGVTGYQVERCQGAGCSTFTQVGAPSSSSFSDTGLTASTSYSYRVRATDAAGNLSGYSSVASATTTSGSSDTQPPTAPTVSILAASSTEIDIAWSGSTDNVGVTGYVVESCSGAGCSNFTAIGTPTTTPFYITGLSANTSYSFRLRAVDAAGNASLNSNVVTLTTPVASPDCN